ncbi:hypothetical protein GUITHDRAFT_111719 [Guillardia theta CCMP2712]|uniref:Uncharacterized protein n=1 Tax=Guillardia theta (strain CCMP2712) TaxID=905079 RepID=L1J1F7_GUITC|nr:hypothetical protein GUITHDRAFT_111719 [Guillardia theta CCMP2712]EKX42152.1 hypothetical protein GUITHDRAFT_111719 [Guillardia theta CCMP2712]|eukprot:XP_005829132.1 hypothetical protein GUITHDRAFT_111719 [Guillardia theta CCMP2712]
MWTPAAGSDHETTWPTQLLMPSIINFTSGRSQSISCAWCAAPMNCLKTCASSLLVSAVDYFKMQERMKLMEKDTDASKKLTSVACVYMCCKCVRQTDFCQIFRYLGGFARKYEMKDNIMVGSHHLVNPKGHYKHYNSALKLLVNGVTFANVMQYASNQDKVPCTRLRKL